MGARALNCRGMQHPLSESPHVTRATRTPTESRTDKSVEVAMSSLVLLLTK